MVYIFSINLTPDDDYYDFLVSIVQEDYFKEHGCLNDKHLEDELFDSIPDFYEIMESVFETELSLSSARSALINAGLIESTDLHSFIESCK
ncbi:hypothetical protein pEaSNUABM49_00537 [Erwinia phage pEa_SNUABM_49]|nr:hypothetical protein pEaSNUABM49_00537 [Erwinia phage pEa_SNUABM_49]